MSKEELSPSLRSGNTTILFHHDYKASLLQQAGWPQSDSLEIAMEIRTHAFKDLIAVVIQSLSHVRFFATPWAAARQASLSFTISRSLFKLMSTELVIPSNHLPSKCFRDQTRLGVLGWYGRRPIQPSHPLWPPFPLALSLCQHQDFFQ